jgi:hypothetical protein
MTPATDFKTAFAPISLDATLTWEAEADSLVLPDAWVWGANIADAMIVVTWDARSDGLPAESFPEPIWGG